MIAKLKAQVCGLAEAMGGAEVLANSSWRRNRLLILCYHGTSLRDEHHWNPGLYVSQELLRRRMEMVARAGCSVLPLDEALTRLNEGTLPPKSVAITVDDGSYDFYKVGFPVFREFGFPVTLYYTTYYAEYNRPVFDPMCSYLVWKAKSNAGALTWPEVMGNISLPLDTDVGRAQAVSTLKQYSIRQNLSGRQKDALLAELADRLNIDYEELCRSRILHLSTLDEIRELVGQGLDVQYHTHRHRVYRSAERMQSELSDNRERILRVTSVEPRHFCYTGGFYLPQFPSILRELGLHSATTCQPGLCSRSSDSMLLPRLLDTSGLSDLMFRSWLTGVAELFPRRVQPMSEGQLVEEEDRKTRAPASSLPNMSGSGS